MIEKQVTKWLFFARVSNVAKQGANGDYREIAIMTLRFLSSCLTVKTKSKFNFCKIARMVTIAKLPSWHCTSFRHSWRLKKSRNSFLQIFAKGSLHGLYIIPSLVRLIWRFKLKKKLNFIFEKFCVAITNWPSWQLASFFWLGEVQVFRVLNISSPNSENILSAKM